MFQSMAEELYYSLALISAVLVFQAIVRYSNKRTQRLRQEAYCRTTSSSNSHNNASSPALSYTSLPELDATCAESLDGDEPPVFFELLSQTGSEMMNTSHRSIENIVRERMDSDEAEDTFLTAPSNPH